MKLVVGYCRVSTTQQEEDGLSLDAQADRIRRWVSDKGWGMQADCMFVEAKSGKSAANRPQFQAALRKAIDLKAAFVVCKLDRFARSVADAVIQADRLREGGADLVILDTPIDTTSPYGEAMFGMMAVFAQLVRRMIASHTKDALDHKKSKGEAYGNIPFGYRGVKTGVVRTKKDGSQTEIKRLEIDEREQAVLAAMREIPGGWREKARELNKRGLLSRAGKPWSGGQVRRLLLGKIARTRTKPKENQCDQSSTQTSSSPRSSRKQSAGELSPSGA